MTKIKRQEIAAKLKQGVSRERILDDIIESVSGKLGWHHLMARKDKANIEQAYGLKDVQHHRNDHQSVFVWKEELRQTTEDNPTLFYKLPGQEEVEGFNLSKDGFSITIQSPTRKGSDGQQEEIEHILTNVLSRPDNITTLKTRVKGTTLQIMEEVYQCTSSSALKQLKNQTTAAACLLASLKSDKEQEVISLKVQFKVNENSPATKNMETRQDSTQPKSVVLKPKYDLHVQRMKNSRPS